MTCTSRCVYARTPVESCTCSVCNGSLHGSRQRPALMRQELLFPECGGENLAVLPVRDDRADRGENLAVLPVQDDRENRVENLAQVAGGVVQTAGGTGWSEMAQTVNESIPARVAQRLAQAAAEVKCTKCGVYLRRFGCETCARCS